MLILALDTTTRAGSCALLGDAGLLREEGSDAGRPPAARLPGDLMTLLEHAGMPLDAVDVFAVATGPGSFTGLRIGIATMQGLAFALGKPLVGVSALDALARVAVPGGPPSLVATWVDAWRGEVYAAVYGSDPALEEPIVAAPESLLDDYAARLSVPAGALGQMIFIGDGAGTYRDRILQQLPGRAVIAEPPTPLLAATVATLAGEAVRRGELPSPHAIRPLYVRRPDAELARNRK